MDGGGFLFDFKLEDGGSKDLFEQVAGIETVLFELGEVKERELVGGFLGLLGTFNFDDRILGVVVEYDFEIVVIDVAIEFLLL